MGLVARKGDCIKIASGFTHQRPEITSPPCPRTKRPEVRVLSGGPSNHPRQSEVIRICNSAGLASSACYTVRTPPGVAEPGETSLGQRPLWRFTRLFSPRPVPAAVAAFPRCPAEAVPASSLFARASRRVTRGLSQRQ